VCLRVASRGMLCATSEVFKVKLDYHLQENSENNFTNRVGPNRILDRIFSELNDIFDVQFVK